jgi:hypothetical protein
MIHMFTIEGNGAVHLAEVVFVGRRHRLRRPAGAHRLVFLLARLELVAPAGDSEENEHGGEQPGAA